MWGWYFLWCYRDTDNNGCGHSLVRVVPRTFYATKVPRLTRNLNFSLPRPLPNCVRLLARLFRHIHPTVLRPRTRYSRPLFPQYRTFRRTRRFPPRRLPPYFVRQSTYVLILGGVFGINVLFLTRQHFRTSKILHRLRRFPRAIQLRIRLGDSLFHNELPTVFPRRIAHHLFSPISTLRGIRQSTSNPPLVHGNTNSKLASPPHNVNKGFRTTLQFGLFHHLRRARVTFLGRVRGQRTPPYVTLYRQRRRPRIHFTRLPPNVLIPNLHNANGLHFLFYHRRQRPTNFLRVNLCQIIRHRPLYQGLVFRPTSLHFVRHERVLFLFNRIRTTILRYHVRLIRLHRVMVLFIRNATSLLQYRNVITYPHNRYSNRFLHLQRFLRNSYSFPLLLRPRKGTKSRSSANAFPYFFSHVS